MLMRKYNYVINPFYVLSITLVNDLIIVYTNFTIANLIVLIQYMHLYLFSDDNYKCNITNLKKKD